ncbi:tectonin domain-containing protein [Thalassospira australica]|uniref:tectonin domain-containing protein n=1 Tax=Thalassospira australica TaxID=1528106 RepID=UPI0012E00397|nr:tectonin domain-containing protein [Thalassospira australica]
MSNTNNASISVDMAHQRIPQTRTRNSVSYSGWHFTVALVVLILGLAGMMFANSPARAETTCGGLDKNGNLQESCEGRPAKYEGKPGTSCPSGQFYDLEACWSCPSGYSRSGDHVTTGTACHKVTDKDIFSDAKPAQRLSGVSQCPSGSFFDMYNGGTCWRCPSGYNRTIFDPVYSDKACERVTGFLQFSWRKAEFKGAECGGDNTVYDLIDGGTCWSCPDGYVRTINSVKSNQACGRPIFETASAEKKGEAGCKQYGNNAFWDPKNFGSCYSCPAGYTRSKESVDSPRGCLAPAIEWEMAPYAGKGFMQMDGAAEVVLKLIEERTELERIAVSMGRAVGTDGTRSVEALWQEIAQFPEESLALRYAVLNHVISAVESGRVSASSPEGRLIREIETFANGYRVYLATEAIKAYDVWHAAQTIKLKNKQEANTKAGRSDMRFLFSDLLPVPPNFEQVTNRAALVNTVAAVPTLGMFSTALVPLDDGSVADQMIYKVFPNRTDGHYDQFDEITNLEDKMKRVGQEAGDSVDNILGSSDDVGKVATKVGQEMGERADDAARVAAKAAFKVSKKLITKMLAVSGPQIVIEIATAIFEAELNKNLAKADARPALMRALEHAKSYKPSLKVWLQNKDEAAKVYSYWALAASNEVRPSASDLKKIEAAAGAHYKDTRFSADPLYFVYNEGQWHNFDGGATAISAGPSGDVWHVGGGHVYWADPVNDNTWSEIGGGNNVVDIAAMPARKEAFALFEGGAMKVYDGRSWRNVPGIGHAVDVGPDGRKWHIGGSNSLYVSGPDDFRWQRVNGPKAKKISAGPGGMLWVIDTNDKLHYLLNDQWKDFGRKAQDVAVSPEGAVWITSLGNEVFRLSYNGQWKKGNGGTIHQVDAGEAGTLWALRPDNAIVMYRHKSASRPPMADPGSFIDSTKTIVQDNGITITHIEVDEPTVTYVVMSGPKKWRDVAGIASQVSIGKSGDIWHIGGSGSLYIQPKGHLGWKQVLASGVAHVEADRLANNAFILTTDGKMWNIDSLGKKTQISGWASDIAVDDAGTQWHVGGNGSIYRMGGNGWVQVPGNVSRIAAGANGEVWSVGRNGEIYQFANNRWNEMPGSARDVAVGLDGSVWHLGGPNGDVLYKWNAKDKNWKGVDETKAQTVSIGPDGEIWVARPDGSMTVYD